MFNHDHKKHIKFAKISITSFTKMAIQSLQQGMDEERSLMEPDGDSKKELAPFLWNERKSCDFIAIA